MNTQPSPTGPSVQVQALLSLVLSNIPDPARIEAMLADLAGQIPDRLRKAAQHRIYVTNQFLT